MAEKPQKTLGLVRKRRRESDPSEEDDIRSRPKTEGTAKPSRHRSLSLGHRDRRTNTVPARSEEELYTTATDSGIGTTRGFLLPGHNYLGPGNPLDNGPPTNRVDEAARRHDLDYQQASTSFQNTGNQEEAFQSIQQADETFLSNLSDIEPSSYTEFFGKLVGQAGIGIKKKTEGLLHSTLYPRFNVEGMDVVDGPEEECNKLNITPFLPGPSIINMGHGIRPCYKTQWKFSKSFEIGFESKLFEFKKSDATSGSKGVTEIKAFFHSLPWEKLYFYLTEREYNTVLNSFHTAYVEEVKVKIFNLGVTNTSVQGTNSVSFKNITPNHYLGVWRSFEKHGPVKLGDKITPTFLYGKPISDFPVKTSFDIVEEAKVGAISEMKVVDNRVTYRKITSEYDVTTRKSLNLGEANIYLPPSTEMATLRVNAANAIGLIYQTTYKPKDGLFHNRSYAFHNNSVIQHKPYDVNIDLAGTGKIEDAQYVISGSTTEDLVNYEDATINNMFFRSIRVVNPLTFVDGLAVGLFPKRSKDGKNFEACAEIGINTEIVIKGESFGGSVLSSGSATYPQSNPNRIYFIHKNKKFDNAYASDGLPTLGNKKD